MDVNRLVNMIAKIAFAVFAKQLVQYLRKPSAARLAQDGSEHPPSREQDAQTKELEKRARDTAKLMRRLGR